VVRLGQLAGWSPLPISVRDARRRAPSLRERLPQSSDRARSRATGEPAVRARGVVVRYGDTVAVRDLDLDVHTGEVMALMGRNGSGKSSLLWAMQGTGGRQGGTVTVGPDGADTARLDNAAARRAIGLVPQSPGDLLYLQTVAEECELADRESGSEPGRCRAILDRIVPGIAADTHPRDLSEGQRLALALAVQLCPRPGVVLLDEPTRGLDESAKRRFAAFVRELAADGHAVVIATHDVEFVAVAADRVVVLADGEVVADGPTADVVVASPVFAPQVAKVMRPDRWLSVAEVEWALAGVPT
jgi:energy-coupling factor transport system ATP-binding protein